MHGKREKLKDVTIRPGDSVSIRDETGSRKTVLIDGLKVHTSEGSVFERSREDDEGGHRGGGQGKGRHHGHDSCGSRHGDD
jgi:hypothetical protein